VTGSRHASGIIAGSGRAGLFAVDADGAVFHFPFSEVQLLRSENTLKKSASTVANRVTGEPAANPAKETTMTDAGTGL
jgi:hypothetical protein